MLHTENRIEIQAPVELVFHLAADVRRWPDILVHYSYVQLEDEGPGGTAVEMAVRHFMLPVRWGAIQRLDHTGHRILYRHVRGATLGMDVVWEMAAGPGGTTTSIRHDLRSPRWWFRNPLAEYVMGRIFVSLIAEKTLKGIKMYAEEQAMLTST